MLDQLIKRFDLLILPFTKEQEQAMPIGKLYPIEAAFKRLHELGQLPKSCTLEAFTETLKEYERDGLGWKVVADKFCRVPIQIRKAPEPLTVQDLAEEKEQRVDRLYKQTKTKKQSNQATLF